MTVVRIQLKPLLLTGLLTLMSGPVCEAEERRFAGVVSSATPEATAAGVGILEKGGNAIDAAVAVSLALGVSEPAGSGIAGQTVMLVKPAGSDAFVIHGTTWSPSEIPPGVTKQQLAYGHTASTVPSTLRVLDLAQQRFGSGNLSWADLVQPAARIARDGFVIGPFRAQAFRHYASLLLGQPAAASIFTGPDQLPWQKGQLLCQPKLAVTLDRIANAGAMDFYQGALAAEIVTDMEANGGWITARDLHEFPEPRIVEALHGTYRGYQVSTLPPPFGGWVVLQILNVLERVPNDELSAEAPARKLALLDAIGIGHTSRRASPVSNYTNYIDEIGAQISKPRAQQLLDIYQAETGGETTHFSVVDGDGMVVAVTQSIDSYFGARVAHPELGFLYNNYMQGFQVEDPGAPYYLTASEMPKSSMSATLLQKDKQAVLVLGSPGSARIISSVAQVVSHWVDVGAGVEAAVAAFRVHVVPPDHAYVEGPELGPELLGGMATRGLNLTRPVYGVSNSYLDPYFGGVHAIAVEKGIWTGSADPRRDGRVGYAWYR